MNPSSSVKISSIQSSKQLSRLVNRKTRQPQNSPDWSSVKVRYVVYLDLIRLNPGLDSSYDQQQKVIYYPLGQKSISPYNFTRSEQLYGESYGKFPLIWFSS
jgi:hypothetical protein